MTPIRLETYFAQDPRRLFLVDASGAFVSALLLGVVLVRLEDVFGIPAAALYLLALLPIFFIAIDLFSYFREAARAKVFLRVIAWVNISYCFLSIGVGLYHYEALTALGWAYLIGEVGVVVGLALFELRVARRVA